MSLTLYFFFFNDTATTEIYTLSLHDALPICAEVPGWPGVALPAAPQRRDIYVLPWSAFPESLRRGDRKSTRLNSSHANISYAVFCLKKKKNNRMPSTQPR